MWCFVRDALRSFPLTVFVRFGMGEISETHTRDNNLSHRVFAKRTWRA